MLSAGSNSRGVEQVVIRDDVGDGMDGRHLGRAGVKYRPLSCVDDLVT